MSDLTINLDELESLISELANSWAGFESAATMSAGLADAVGHDGKASELAGAVQGFAGGWSIRRQKICDAMEATLNAVKAIHDAFVDADQKMTDVLTGAQQ